ncbi:MAG: hypothetical protein NZM11_07625 [Anaerolineales bacterium]|nr:hypothetical protein [Anaerolineales bacterium]
MPESNVASTDFIHVFSPRCRLNDAMRQALRQAKEISGGVGSMFCRGVTGTRMLLVWLIALSLLAVPNAFAQNPLSAPTPFPQTGHAVDPTFAAYFEARGGVAEFGYPITYAYIEKGLLVQYFQNVRMEYHPYNPDPYKIQLGLLGEELGKRQPPIPVNQIPSPTDPSCVYFPQFGHAVCHSFLKYYNEHGQLDRFGYPISSMYLEKDRLVQWFQRARMEFHPGRPEGQRVSVAPLGRIYRDEKKLDRTYEIPRLSDNSASFAVVQLRARATVASPIIRRGATQTVHVTVTDQLNAPVQSALVMAIIHYPDGAQSLPLSPTDSRGVTSASFNAGRYKAGTVIAVEVQVSYQGLMTKTPTSYLLWFY